MQLEQRKGDRYNVRSEKATTAFSSNPPAYAARAAPAPADDGIRGRRRSHTSRSSHRDRSGRPTARDVSAHRARVPPDAEIHPSVRAWPYPRTENRRGRRMLPPSVPAIALALIPRALHPQLFRRLRTMQDRMQQPPVIFLGNIPG